MRTRSRAEGQLLLADPPQVRRKATEPETSTVTAAAVQARRLDVLSPGAVRQLQRYAGNMAVAALLQRCTSTALCGPCAKEEMAEEQAEGKGGDHGPAVAGGAGGAKAKGEPVADDQIKTKGEPVADDQIKTDDATAAPSPAGSTVPVSFATESVPEPTQELQAKGKVCPAPGGKIQRLFPEAKSTSAAIAAMGACTWGITAPDNLVVTTHTCEDGSGNWTLRVMGVTSKIRKFSRLLAGQSEPTTASSTKTNFCDQAHELDVLGTCSGAWYMLSAVKAHENVHVGEWKTSFPTDWPAVQATIEALTVPKSGATAKQKDATKALRSSTGFTDAMKTGTANFPTFWGIPDPNANTNAAERAIVDPRITAICKKAQSKKWDPSTCAECSARSIV